MSIEAPGVWFDVSWAGAQTNPQRMSPLTRSTLPVLQINFNWAYTLYYARARGFGQRPSYTYWTDHWRGGERPDGSISLEDAETDRVQSFPVAQLAHRSAHYSNLTHCGPFLHDLWAHEARERFELIRDPLDEFCEVWSEVKPGKKARHDIDVVLREKCREASGYLSDLYLAQEAS